MNISVDFTIPTDHRVKNKRKWKTPEISGPCQRVKKKLWNMKETVIAIIVGVHGTNKKNLENWMG